mmetsp:Transcript_37193/g.57127  ORF Transcript_37193/g.57127 Transcript_37193/m.57127 type:complete len:84 (+) Transcript_37193:164-415(+)
MTIPRTRLDQATRTPQAITQAAQITTNQATKMIQFTPPQATVPPAIPAAQVTPTVQVEAAPGIQLKPLLFRVFLNLLTSFPEI